MFAVVINTGFFGTFPFMVLGLFGAMIVIKLLDLVQEWVHEEEDRGSFLFREVRGPLYLLHPGLVIIFMLLAFLVWTH
jgi:hypothetical protein